MYWDVQTQFREFMNYFSYWFSMEKEKTGRVKSQWQNKSINPVCELFDSVRYFQDGINLLHLFKKHK